MITRVRLDRADRPGDSATPLLAFISGTPVIPTGNDVLAVPMGLAPVAASYSVEYWHVDRDVEVAHTAEMTIARAGDLVAGKIPATGDDLHATTGHCYQKVVEILRKHHVHALRLLHSIPRILGESRHGNRYIESCAARADALDAASGPERRPCGVAATAVGSRERDLVLVFLAPRAPGTALENPWQVLPRAYPPQHGVRTPEFARAVRGSGSLGYWTFGSGTARIGGHRSQGCIPLPGTIRRHPR